MKGGGDGDGEAEGRKGVSEGGGGMGRTNEGVRKGQADKNDWTGRKE